MTLVALASDQVLVAESVGAALAAGSYDVALLGWPALGPRVADRAAGVSAHRLGARQAADTSPNVGLLISDLERTARVREAQLVIKRLHVPWLVLTGAPPGAVWGALLESGATLVAGTSTTLEETDSLLRDVLGGLRTTAPRRRRELVREWQEFTREREELHMRLGSLTQREEELLRLLHAGESSETIAMRSGVTAGTVRMQVRSVLRKLDADSQIAAVAIWQMSLEDPATGPDGSAPVAPPE